MAATTLGDTSGRKWAPVQFAAARPIEVPAATLQHVRSVTAAQRDDTDRFRSAAPSLLERLEVDDGVLVVITCDRRFAPLVANWVAGCDRVGCDIRGRTLVFATDVEAYRIVDAMGLVVYYDAESSFLASMSASTTFGDAAWREFMFHQNWVIEQCLHVADGVDLLFQDADVVWRRDPIDDLHDRALSGVDIQAMYDGPNPRFQPLYANSGFMYLRNIDRVREFWAEVYGRHDLVAVFGSQQQPLNVLLAAYAQRGLEVVVLDEERYANGHLYCGQRVAPDDPWVVHHSWTQNLDVKIDRYHTFGHWFLEADAENDLAPK